jgi:hypothetical protein
LLGFIILGVGSILRAPLIAVKSNPKISSHFS